MKKLIILLLILPITTIFLINNSNCSNETNNPVDCTQLSKDNILNIVKNITTISDIKIIEINNSPIKGLCEVAIETKGKKGILYIDSSQKYLLSGAILEIKTKSNITQVRLSELNKVDVSQIPLDDAIIMGDKDAKLRVIVFTDPDCPYCAKLHKEIKKIIQKRNDIVFFIKMFPLPFHKNAYAKAKTIVCQKSLSFLDDAFKKKSLPEPECETKVIDDNIELAKKLGIRGTPAIILSNGMIIPGYKNADSLISLIDKFH